MRHMKTCVYEHFASIAEIKYADLRSQKYIRRFAIDSTHIYMGQVMRSTDIEYIDDCVCRKHKCDEYFKNKRDEVTRERQQASEL